MWESVPWLLLRRNNTAELTKTGFGWRRFISKTENNPNWSQGYTLHGDVACSKAPSVTMLFIYISGMAPYLTLTNHSQFPFGCIQSQSSTHNLVTSFPITSNRPQVFPINASVDEPLSFSWFTFPSSERHYLPICSLPFCLIFTYPRCLLPRTSFTFSHCVWIMSFSPRSALQPFISLNSYFCAAMS